MLIEDEPPEDTVIRSGQQKLGVKLKVVKYIGEGEIERETFILNMKEYEAEIVNGEPFAPQDIEGMTQYQKCEYKDPFILKEAAQKGSLCSRIFLEYMEINWD